jgi:hypothetical protein
MRPAVPARTRPASRIIPVVAIVLALAAPHPATATEEPPPMHRITGRFDVKMTPQGEASPDTGATTYRLDKRYHGPLDANAAGTMLGHVTATQGSAGYVAIERVTGTLDGRKGSFVLQHSGLMDRGAKHLEIRVVPDSADGELVGLRGRMEIRIEAGGAHYYDFEYTLAND